MRQRVGIALAMMAVFLWPGLARSDEPENKAALAQALFEKARDLMMAKRYSEACPKLAESQRLEPRLGVLMNLAACHELEGRTASAWAEYTEVRAQSGRAGRADREAWANAHAEALEPKLSRVTITAERPSDALEVSMDGAKLLAGALGTALPVDPGHHVLRASAPGRAEWSTSFDIEGAAVQRALRIPELATLALPVVSSAPGPPPPAEPVRPASRPVSPFVWALGGLALGGIAAGSYFGINAFTKNADATHECPTNDGCSARALDLDRTGHTSATISTIAFSVAAVAALGAVVLFVVGEGAPQPVAQRATPLLGRW